MLKVERKGDSWWNQILYECEVVITLLRPTQSFASAIGKDMMSIFAGISGSTVGEIAIRDRC
jgi:hypothetical protein